MQSVQVIRQSYNSHPRPSDPAYSMSKPFNSKSAVGMSTIRSKTATNHKNDLRIFMPNALDAPLMLVTL